MSQRPLPLVGHDQHDRRRVAHALLIAAGVTTLVMALVVVLSQGDAHPADFTREPGLFLAALDMPSYSGFVANINSILWIVAGTCTAVAVAALPEGDRHRRLMLCVSIATWAVLIDDRFLVHQILADNGIPDAIPQIGYMFGFAWVIFSGREIVGRTVTAVSLLAVGCLGLSAGLDQLLVESEINEVIEDTPKFLGIVSWCTLWTVMAIRSLRAAIGTSNADAPRSQNAEVRSATKQRANVSPTNDDLSHV